MAAQGMASPRDPCRSGEVNAEDFRRFEHLVAELLRAIEEAAPNTITTLAVRKDRAGHVCLSSEVVAPRRPLVLRSGRS